MAISVVVLPRPPHVSIEGAFENNFRVAAHLISIPLIWAVAIRWSTINPKKTVIDLQRYFTSIHINIYMTAEPFEDVSFASLMPLGEGTGKTLKYKISMNVGTAEYVREKLAKYHPSHEHNMAALEYAGVVDVHSLEKLDPRQLRPQNIQERSLINFILQNDVILGIFTPNDNRPAAATTTPSQQTTTGSVDKKGKGKEKVEDLLNEMKIEELS
jgi:hypothetical protein